MIRIIIECLLIFVVGGMATHILIVEDERDEYRFYWHECLEELEELDGSRRLSPP